MKTLKRIILAGIVLVVLLGLGAYVAVKIAMPPEKIRGIISAKGSEALGRKVDVGEIRVGLFPHIKVSVHEVNVANALGFSADPMIKLSEMNLSINFFSLLRFAPVIQEIKIVEPEILYEVDAAGRNNLEGLGGKATPAPAQKPASGPPEIPAAVALKSLAIVDGSVRYRDAKSSRELTLGRINQRVSLDLDPRLQDVVSAGRLELTQISVRDGASGLKKGDLKVFVTHDFRLDLPGERLQLKKLELTFQDIRIQVEGSISRFLTKPLEVDLRVSAPAISLASVLKEVPASLSPEIPKLHAAGHASFSAHIRGKVDSAALPDVEALVTVRAGALKHSDVPLGIERLEVDASLRHDSLRLAKLAFDMGPNPVRVEALVVNVRQLPRLEKLVVDAALDLGSLAALAQRMGLLDPKIAVSGTETVKLQASGPLDPANPQKLSAAGTVELRAVSVHLPGKPPMRADGKIQITNDKMHEQLAVKVGQSDVAVTVDVSNYLALALPKLAKGGRAKALVQVRSGYLNLDELMPPPAKAEEEKAGPPMKAYPPLPPVDADVNVTLARTRFMGLEMSQFQMQTVARAKDITTHVKGNLYAGTFSTALKMTPQSATNMGVAVKVNTGHVEANDFISRLNDRVPLKNKLFQSLAGADSVIFGKLNLNADLATHGLPDQFAQNLTGALLFALADGKLRESGLTEGLSGALAKVNSSLGFRQLTFGSLKADARVENGKVLIRNFTLDSSPIGAMLASGQIGFDNALSFELTQALPPAISKVVGGASSALAGQLSKLVPVPGANLSLVPTDQSGRALLYYVVGGALSKPTFSLDTQRMAKEGVGSAKSSLADAARQKKEEVKAKVETEVKAKVDSVKTEVKKQAVDEAKKEGKKLLKGLGF